MSKRIITAILLLAFLIFNLTACFDTDDLFDNVIAPEGSVPENTEKSTTIELTEEPTEEPTEKPLETTPVDDSTPEKETYSPNGEAVTLNKTVTFTSSLVTQEDYGMTLDEMNTLLTNERYSFKMATSGGIKNAYEMVSMPNNLNNFGSLVYLGPYTFLSIYDGFYAIDGKDIGDEYTDQTVLVIKFRSSSAGFYSASIKDFENGVLKLNLDYSAAMSGDGALSIFAVIMIEKSFFEGEDLTTIEFVFNGEILIPGY